MLFLKDHLLGDYTWASESDKSIFTGGPTRRRFDRYNGDQVLFIINIYALTLDNFSIQTGQEVEALILNNLPLQASSEISVFNWLKNLQTSKV